MSESGTDDSRPDFREYTAALDEMGKHWEDILAMAKAGKEPDHSKMKELLAVSDKFHNVVSKLLSQ